MASNFDMVPGWTSTAFDPSNHLMKIERYDRIAQKKTSTDYMNVQNRLMWFIRDQRMLIAAGLATAPYTIQTDLIEMDRERGYAHFKTFIRDVLGNEVTMYGSETANDFPDFAEKASTKSLGRALVLLGYGTAFATEFDEGDRVVDAPQQSKEAPDATPAQVANIQRAYKLLHMQAPNDVEHLSAQAIEQRLTELRTQYVAQKAKNAQPAQANEPVAQ